MTRRPRAFLAALACALSVASVTPARSAPLVGWTKLEPGTSPRPRLNAAMAYDPDANRVVLFGGWTMRRDNTLFPTNDTWIWDGTDWTKIRPPVSPPPRQQAAMAYDAKNKRVVLFGGSKPDDPFAGDTWTFDGTRWRELKTATAPAGRVSATMAYDSVRGQIVLFGGVKYNRVTYTKALADTWILEGSTWRKATPSTSPPARAAASAAELPLSGVYLFGGMDRSGAVLGDTWRWDGTTWTAAGLGMSDTDPPARVGGALAHDGLGCLVLHGGYVPEYPYHPHTKTFASNGVTWNEIEEDGIGSRVGATMTTAPGGGVLLFGGGLTGMGTTIFRETWVYRTAVAFPGCR